MQEERKEGDERGKDMRQTREHLHTILWLQTIITHDVICVAWNSGIQGVQFRESNNVVFESMLF